MCSTMTDPSTCSTCNASRDIRHQCRRRLAGRHRQEAPAKERHHEASFDDAIVGTTTNLHSQSPLQPPAGAAALRRLQQRNQATTKETLVRQRQRRQRRRTRTRAPAPSTHTLAVTLFVALISLCIGNGGDSSLPGVVAFVPRHSSPSARSSQLPGRRGQSIAAHAADTTSTTTRRQSPATRVGNTALSSKPSGADSDNDEAMESSSSSPLFVDRTPGSASYGNAPPQGGDAPSANNDGGGAALRASFDRVRRSILGTGRSNPDDADDDDDDDDKGDATKRINLAIVERGQRFASASSSASAWANLDAAADSSTTTSSAGGGGGAILASERQRVPGCVATVHVRTTLVPLGDTDDGEHVSADGDDAAAPSNYRVVVDGDADALLSRGLLALLSDALGGESVTAADVLNHLEPDAVADLLGLRPVLSTGRNDGVASMTAVLREQIRQQSVGGLSGNLEEEEDSSTSTVDTGSAPRNGEKRPTVAMLLSGGVDSSVALNLLVREGYDMTAFYLKIWLEDELSHLGECPWEDDYSVCQAVCEQAGVPLETVSLQKEYKDRVISYTVDEARKGRTPNPDIMCNSRVKFGCFYDAIAGRGFDYVASGHYAQLVEGDEDGSGERQMRLLRAPDPVKDQTYFLCALTQEQLSRVKFPIGSFLKSEVRDLAQKFGLPNRNRPDSQGLCFLGKVKFDAFINAYLGTNPGDIVDATTGRVIGRHNGLWYHTVGQRKGIGKVLHPTETAKGPWYIVAKDQERNIVIASNEYDQEAFEEARSDFYVEDITWVAGSPPSRLVQSTNDGEHWKDGRFTMKIRHGPTMVNGTLTLDEAEADGTGGSVHLDSKDKGLAPGQYCVFYNLEDEECLGAGVISERHWAKLLLETNMSEEGGKESAAVK